MNMLLKSARLVLVAILLLVGKVGSAAVLSNNPTGGDYPGVTPNLTTTATYKWLDNNTGDGRGNTDATILTQDGGVNATNQRMHDGMSLAGGGNFGVFHTWDGSKGATLQFDLGRSYSLDAVQISTLLNPAGNATGVSLAQVWTSPDGITFTQWGEWAGPAPTAADSNYLINIKPATKVDARYVQVFVHRSESMIKGSYSTGNTWYHQIALGEIVILGTAVPSAAAIGSDALLLSNNASTGDYPAASPKLTTSASYKWIDNNTGDGRGNTDSMILSQDGGSTAPNQRLRDGVSLVGGGGYGLFQNWDDSKGATLEYDLGTNYNLDAVQVSALFNTAANGVGVSLLQVWTSVDGTNFSLWGSWAGPPPTSNNHCVLTVRPGNRVSARYVQVFVHRNEAAITGSLTAGNTWYHQIALGEVAIFGNNLAVAGNIGLGVSSHMIHTPFFMNGVGDGWNVTNTMPRITEANLRWVREPLYQGYFDGLDSNTSVNGKTFAANRTEVERCIAAYQYAGINVILTPMYYTPSAEQDRFGNWVAHLVDSYSCIKAIELYNEPNLSGFWSGTIDEFITASNTFAVTAKSSSRKVPILVGSFSGWGGCWDHPHMLAETANNKEAADKWAVEAFKRGMLNIADGVSAHPYRGNAAPEGGDVIESQTDPEGFLKEINHFNDLVKSYSPGGKELPIYFTEIGYSSASSGGSSVAGSETRKADYLSRLAFTLIDAKLSGSPVAGMFWYDLKKDESGNNYEDNFGLISVDTTSTTAGFTVYKQIAASFGEGSNFQRLPTSISFSTGGPYIQSKVWTRSSDGAIIVPFWRMNQLQSSDTDISTNLSLKLPTGFSVQSVTLHDLNAGTATTQTYSLSGQTLTAAVTASARAAWLEIKKN